MITVHMKYDNDRGTPQPERDEKGRGRFWSFQINYHGVEPSYAFLKWQGSLGKNKFTRIECEDKAVELGKMIGVQDTTSDAQWRAQHVEISYDSPSGFVNWPDPQ